MQKRALTEIPDAKWRFRQSVLIYRLKGLNALDDTAVFPVIRLTRFSSRVQMQIIIRSQQ